MCVFCFFLWACCVFLWRARCPAFLLPCLCWACCSVGRVPSRPAPSGAVVVSAFGALAWGLGCCGRLSVVPFVVGFLAGFLRVWCASFSRLGRLFSVLGRLFCGLGGVGWVVLFRIFVSWSVPALRFLPRSPRPLPWFVCSGGRACSVGSRWRCRVSPCRLGCPARSASPRLALASRLGSAVGSAALGGWAGRSRLLALLRWVCRSARVACRLLAFSFRFFSCFAVWHPPLGFLVCWFFLTFAPLAARIRHPRSCFFAASDGGKFADEMEFLLV